MMIWEKLNELLSSLNDYLDKQNEPLSAETGNSS
jgi:hypothetical protein